MKRCALFKKKTVGLLCLGLALVLLSIGIASATVGAEEAPPPLTVGLTNLSFRDAICIKYAISAENVSVYEDVRLLCWKQPQESYEKDTAALVLEPVGKLTKEGVTYIVFDYEGLSAKQMTEEIYTRAYLADGEKEYYGELKKFSILEYAYTALGKLGNTAVEDADFCALMQEMLKYGAAAQTYFDHNIDRLADGEYVFVSVDSGTLADGTSTGLFTPNAEVTLRAPETDADGKSFSHWTDSESGAVIENIEITVSAQNANKYTPVYTAPYSQGLSFVSNGDGTCYVSGIGTCTDTVLRIPPVSPEKDSVIAIGANAFKVNETITNLILPNSVERIGDSAFYQCKKLEYVLMPDSVRGMASYAFYGCEKLIGVTLSNNLYSVGEYGFSGCRALTYISNGSGMTEIPKHAFSYCTSLFAFEVGDRVTTIGESAFVECTSLQDVTIGSSVQVIQPCAFYNTKIKNIVLPDSVLTIGEYAFYSTPITSVSIGSGLYHIGRLAFQDCSALTEVHVTDLETWLGISFGTAYDNDYEVSYANPLVYAKKLYIDGELLVDLVIPDGITSIARYAFANCTSIESITLSEGITSIGTAAFSGCTSLTSMAIPASLTAINPSVFSGCAALSEITVNEQNANYFASGNCLIERDSKTVLMGCKNSVIPDDGSVIAIDVGAFRELATLSEIHIPGSITVIPAAAFYGCVGLQTLSIGSGVQEIGANAFDGCAALKTVVFEEGLRIIGSNAFNGCKQIKNIVIPATVTSIGGYAFRNCSSLEEITIPDSVQGEIAYSCFEGCGALARVIIGDGITAIGPYAFNKCTSLEFVTFGKNVAQISSYAFVSCKNLKSITIPEQVTEIGGRAFAYCENLSEVVIGPGVTIIRDEAFLDCSKIATVRIFDMEAWLDITFGMNTSNPLYYGGNLYLGDDLVTDLVIPEGVTVLLPYAFVGCTSIESVCLPTTLVEISAAAFRNCKALAEVSLPEGLHTIGNYAFQNCTSLTEMAFPSGVTSIGKQPFSGCTMLADLYYEGTEAAWEAIAKASDWNGGMSSYTLHFAVLEEN